MSVRWYLSQWDNRVHAFPAGQPTTDYLEAVCEHTAPDARISRTHEGVRCLACLLIYGAELADRLGDAPQWTM